MKFMGSGKVRVPGAAAAKCEELDFESIWGAAAW